MSNLTPGQNKFYIWLSQNTPELMYLWDWNDKSLNLDAVESYLGTASHGQAIMCRFAIAIWFNKNRYNFDLMEAAGVLGQKQRLAIAQWLMEPLWP